MRNVGSMPPAWKTDVPLQAEMMKRLSNAGWKNIRRLVIVDKDWWNDLAQGGNSTVIGRYIGAAVAAKADDGSCYWCHVTFEQKKQIDGSFAPLELSHTGEKRPIQEENIDKSPSAQAVRLLLFLRRLKSFSETTVFRLIQASLNRLGREKFIRSAGVDNRAATIPEILHVTA